jgi:hypothetical protein
MIKCSSYIHYKWRTIKNITPSYLIDLLSNYSFANSALYNGFLLKYSCGFKQEERSKTNSILCVGAA